LDTLDIKIGRRLRTIRHISKKTQAEIALVLKVTKSTISKYERGELTLTPGTINQVCDYFGLEHAWLLTGKGEMMQRNQQRKAGISEKIAQLPQQTAKAIELLIDSITQ